ncbi:arsenosugar biosynthesis radical SAM (seleno)protein ArsS [Geomesophilobacter sediminis]|uniref:Arsenosugar biosynthesis radical SAM protein ArsS n=1 Tax=Geomesophilobacter sediminis TaxID=2798584 RepID=A0A8J7M2D7_9BACT|nr:arsenosugar biosynthesis radical SAM (seleno)protein ArsS [Geomesophilobacter sediminis]MBJ6727254.1 arsenosugar biosynthesis radical SAM protein ArsS [Geomesophilobacter sediminis]
MSAAHETHETGFAETLVKHDLKLHRDRTSALQVNVGLLCNLACRHCHLEAGPKRDEVMGRETMDEVVAAARRFRFEVIDVTGGAPELVPDIDYLVRALAPLTSRLMLRCNLGGLDLARRRELLELFRAVRPVLVVSLPATNPSQTDALRGGGAWASTLDTLRELNAIGYGREGTSLELNLVANPAGAFLPPAQGAAEKRYRTDLSRKYGISFTSLYTFANVPLGRYRDFLTRSGNLEQYLATLADGFNPCTVAGLMCRSQLSVDWEGRLYDCDFNLAAGLPHGGEVTYLRGLAELPAPGTPIPVGDHCYACTVGSGFT